MATELGSHPGSFPGGGFAWDGLNATPTQVFHWQPSWPGGLVSDVYAYVAGHGGNNFVGWLCIWNGANTLIWNSPQQTYSAGSGTNSGQAWRHYALPTPLYFAPSSGLGIGWAKSQSSYMEWSWATGGSYRTGDNSSNPGNATNVSAPSGTIGAYLLYTPSVGRSRRSGIWVVGTSNDMRGGNEVFGIASVRRGSGWTVGT